MTKFRNDTSWFLYQHSDPHANIRLFCFPYAGGGASIFHKWPVLLPKGIEVFPVQLPGRENRLREPPLTHFTQLIDLLVQAISPYLDKPYAFFGHSMGALICFELTRSLARRGYRTPEHLIISARKAPQKPNSGRSISHLSDLEFVDIVRSLGGTSEKILQNSEVLRLLLPMLRADFTLCETYSYIEEKALVCSISVFGGLQDKNVALDDLLSWREQTSNSFTLRFFTGDHFFIHKDQLSVLEAISNCLGKFT